jgi:hypothetical protein
VPGSAVRSIPTTPTQSLTHPTHHIQRAMETGDDAAAASSTAGPLLPPIEGDAALGHGPWEPSILQPVLQHGGCLRCALRMAGVRRHAAFQVRFGWMPCLESIDRFDPVSTTFPPIHSQAPLPALLAALAAPGPDASQETTASTSTGCCPLCLGILQEIDGVGKAAIAEIVAAVGKRGYDLLEGERRLAFALGLSLPYCEALRTRACWCVVVVVQPCLCIPISDTQSPKHTGNGSRPATAPTPPR